MNVLVNIHAYSAVLVSFHILVHAELIPLLCATVLSFIRDDFFRPLPRRRKIACARQLRLFARRARRIFACRARATHAARMDALAAYGSSSESDDESGGSARPAHMAAGPPPSASGAMSDDEGSESGRDDTERGNVSNDARVPTAASRCPGASSDDDNESDDGASSRLSDDESEGSDDGAKVEAVVNSVKKPVDKSKWGYLGKCQQTSARPA